MFCRRILKSLLKNKSPLWNQIALGECRHKTHNSIKHSLPLCSRMRMKCSAHLFFLRNRGGAHGCHGHEACLCHILERTVLGIDAVPPGLLLSLVFQLCVNAVHGSTVRRYHCLALREMMCRGILRTKALPIMLPRLDRCLQQIRNGQRIRGLGLNKP